MGTAAEVREPSQANSLIMVPGIHKYANGFVGSLKNRRIHVSKTAENQYLVVFKKLVDVSVNRLLNDPSVERLEYWDRSSYSKWVILTHSVLLTPEALRMLMEISLYEFGSE